MEMEKKAFQVEFKANDMGEVTGYAAFFNNKDAYGDIILKGAFSDTILEDMKDIKMVWNHDWDEVPIGTIQELSEDDNGLMFKATLNNTTLAKDVKEAIKSGAVTKMSIGYKTIIKEDVMIDDENVRYLKQLKLYEISPVNFPANNMAAITGYKSESKLKELIKSEIEQYMEQKKLEVEKAEIESETKKAEVERLDIKEFINQLKTITGGN